MDYHVTDFGAVGDGKTDDTVGIQAAIDACSAAGGGRVVLENGRTFLSGSIRLKKRVELHIEGGALLLASPDLEDYIRPNDEIQKGMKDEGVNRVGTPVTLKPSYVFIYAKEADFSSITGAGTVDGNCYAFVKRVDRYYVTGDFYPRPTLIYTEKCNHIRFSGITLQNAPFWSLHPAGCFDVLIDGIRILNPLDVANSDGIDPDHCANVRILGCYIRCADDAICLKASAGNMEYGDTRDIVIADCTLCSTSAAIKIGTEGTGNFRNVLVHDCIIFDSNRGISVQIRDEGHVENVRFHDIQIETRRFSDHWWGAGEAIAVTSFDRDEGTVSGNITDISFENITCRGENGALFACDREGKIRDISLKNVRIDLLSRSKWPKGYYDFRPGYKSGIEKRKTPCLFARNTSDIRLFDCRFRVMSPEEEAFAKGAVTENSTATETISKKAHISTRRES